MSRTLKTRPKITSGAPGKPIVPVIERILDGERNVTREELTTLPRQHMETAFRVLIRRLTSAELTELHGRLQRLAEASRSKGRIA